MKKTFIAEIDERELAVRLMENACGMKRPPQQPIAVTYAELQEQEHFAKFEDLARVAMLFFQESINKTTPTN